MGKYRVLRFEFPELRVPRFGKLGHLNRTEFSAYSSEFSASGKLGQLNLTEFSAYSSEFSAKGVLCPDIYWNFRFSCRLNETSGVTWCSSHWFSYSASVRFLSKTFWLSWTKINAQLPKTYGWIFFSRNFAQFQVVCEFVYKKLVWTR